ncbi:hypothetical protein L1987_46348 [Smallanthus sonchifolius]|uniref:Uncharacterized protein n=1 Tax=Smallanthus sonchifolius TaxID=185202 RepID=A0ACB9G185_9ASTR|nr:hypothetical protein L1987_46348 [Smallanthus sonchifolius]
MFNLLQCQSRTSTSFWFTQPEIPVWKWENLAMDFITKLPRTSSGYDSIWEIIDRLTKSAHFLPIREDYRVEKLARIYIDEIVSRHGVPLNIISDRDGSLLDFGNLSKLLLAHD